MRIAVIGSALRGGGIQVIDILLETMSAEQILLFDDDPQALSQYICGVPVLGDIKFAIDQFHSGHFDKAVVAIGSVEPRKRVYDFLLGSNIPFANVISRYALLSSYSSLGLGNVILPNVYIGPAVVIGNNNYLTTGSQINHDTTIGSHCYFSAGVTVAGRVSIGDCCRLDTSSCITADAVLEDSSLVTATTAFGPMRGR